MAFKSTDARIGAQALDSTSTVQNHPLLTRTIGNDPDLGEGEFIYLKGLASTAVGDAVWFDEAGATTRTVLASRGPIAIAMSANVANQYGWYQIKGVATVNVAASFAADAPISLTSTAGTLDDATTANLLVENARSQSAIDTPSTGKAYIYIDRPFAQGGTAA